MQYQSPLMDITNVQANTVAKPKLRTAAVAAPQVAPQSTQVSRVVKLVRHDPYGWKCFPDDAPPAAAVAAETAAPISVPAPQELYQEKGDQTPAAPLGPSVCNALVQFKCRQVEFSSPIEVAKGQYVVVQGDRGIDIGVVIRVNSDATKTYVERTGPVASVLRHATQAEVNYWATELKDDETTAVEYCQAQVRRHGFEMAIVHAEYQFDKKKLTFYYEARQRIDFVQMLKELYREFGCRIWMEKVHFHE